MKQYKPKISFLLSLGFKKVRTYKHERLSILLPGNPRTLYYFPLYNSFRHSVTHFYPESDNDVEVIVRSLTYQK